MKLSNLVFSTSLVVLWSAEVLAISPLAPPPADRRAERPAAQKSLDNSTSSIKRSYTLPAGFNRIDFDFGVDSEPWDILTLAANGQVVWSMSGRNRRGHRSIPVCSAGPCVIEFQYAKNASVSHGRDTAWVDRVLLRSSVSGRVETHEFNTLTYGVPSGWTGAGTHGGFVVSSADPERSASRPPSQGHLGSSGGPTTSYMQRTIYWPLPTDNTLSFNWFVDSEEGADQLIVRVDGGIVFSASGRERAGRETIDVTGGSHTVRFEYSKDASGDEGLDVARVDNIAARTGGATIYEWHDFAGRPVGQEPTAPGYSLAEWTSGGFGGGWIVQRVTPTRSYVPRQTVGAALDNGWMIFEQPKIDGEQTGQIANTTQATLPNYGNAYGHPGVLDLVTSDDAGALFVSLRTQGSTVLQGDEAGTLTLLFDATRDATLQGKGCSTNPVWPDRDDRRFVVSYAVAPGGTLGSITSVTEERGDCSGGYVALGQGDEPWPITLAVAESPGDLGRVLFEAEVVVTAASDAFVSDRIGFGLRHETSSGTPSTVRFPFRDDGAGPLDDDMGSLETLELAATATIAPGRAEIPKSAACCYPRPVRPELH